MPQMVGNESAAVFFQYLLNGCLDHGKYLIVVVFARAMWKLPNIPSLSRTWGKYDIFRRAFCESAYVGIFLIIVAAQKYKSDMEGMSHVLGAQIIIVDAESSDSTRDQLNRAAVDITDSADRYLHTVAGLSFERFGLYSRLGNGQLRDVHHSPDPGDWKILGRESLAEQVVEQGRPRNCPDVVEKPIADCWPFLNPPKGRRLTFRSLLCVPINFGSEVEGAMCVYSSRLHAFDGKTDTLWNIAQSDLKLVGSLLHQVHQLDEAPGCRMSVTPKVVPTN